MSKRIIIILISLIYQINSLQFKVSGEKKQYCFTKTLLEDDIITLNFVVSSENFILDSKVPPAVTTSS